MLGDIARYLYWVELRRLVRPDRDQPVRLLGKLAGSAQWARAGRRLDLLDAELQRTFPHLSGPERRRVARESIELWARCHAEELLLGTLTPETIGRWIRWRDREHLDAALAPGKGGIYLFPHAGNYMFGIALTGLSGYPLNQLAARGFPPPERRIAGQMEPSPLNVKARQARDDAEDALPVNFMDMERDSTRDLFRALRRGELVGIAADGRGGSKFRPLTFLGRPALFATGPWRLAASTGAAIVPVTTELADDGFHEHVVLPPVFPDMDLPVQERCDALQQGWLRQMEPWLQAHPASYAKWLLHAAERVAMDDHPLFTDIATDERWRRYEDAGW